MDFFLRSPDPPASLAILPGTFNPPTTAHLALANSAASLVDEVLWVLPRSLPHKEFTGASFDDRIAMLLAVLQNQPRCSIGASQGGLFAEIADECRAAYGDSVRLSFLCGRDAAERIAAWDYGRPGEFARMLAGFDLLVADRDGQYRPAAEFASFVRRLPLAPEYRDISATAVRSRIARGESWKHLVPGAVHDWVEKIYSAY